MPSTVEILAHAYTRAAPEHIDELFTANEMPLILVLTSPSGTLRLRTDAVPDDAGAPGPAPMPVPLGWSLDDTFYQAAARALTARGASEPKSLLWRVPTTSLDECLVVACCDHVNGETVAIFMIGLRRVHTAAAS